MIRPQIRTISKFEQDSTKIMELYRHGYTLMDKRLMELVEWNAGKTSPMSVPAAKNDSIIPEDPVSSEQEVMLA